MTDYHNVEMAVAEITGAADHFELTAGHRPIPTPAPTEVLIAVHAAGVNGHDVHHVHNGSHPLLPGETDLPGLEIAGEVVAVGSDVRRWAVGDRVCALLRGGGYAEFAVAPERNCLPVPAGLSWAEAACLPETFFTVWSNVFVDMALAPGETFFMNGGTSGIGVAAVQIASVLGHRVFATARGAEKVAICEKLGAQRAIDYEAEDFALVIADETGGRGVDVILDIVVGDHLQKEFEALAPGGRLVMIGAARGPRAAIDVTPLIRKRLRIGGSLLRPRSPDYKAMVAAALESQVWPHIASGRIKPMLDRTFALAEAEDAIRCLSERRHIGKIALIVRPGAEVPA